MTIDLDTLEATARAATGGPWHWAGNTDTGEPYLATWIKGAGRCQVLSIGSEDRDPDGREAKSMRASLDDCGYTADEIDQNVEDWATDSWGQPRTDPRLEFMTDLMCVQARDLAVFEVAPNATSREDPDVYRADIVGIRHPDAEHIATFDPPTVLALIARLRKAEAERDEFKRLFSECHPVHLAGMTAAREARQELREAEAVIEKVGKRVSALIETFTGLQQMPTSNLNGFAADLSTYKPTDQEGTDA